MTTLEEKKRYIRNINKLTAPAGGKNPHVANCGEYGIIRLDHAAMHDQYGKRIFIVRKSKKIANGGSWTFGSLRKAILAE